MNNVVRARHVPMKCGAPRGPMINRPSIEYTGIGNQLICDDFSGRFFRSTEQAVRDGCQKFIDEYEKDDSIGGGYVNWGDLHQYWGIKVNRNFDYRFGYSPSPDWKVNLGFVFTRCGPGTELYDMFGEEVFLVEPNMDSFPFESYMEV